VVIDPGHGGFVKTGGSSPNNATSYTGVLEKNMTLEMAKLVRSSLVSQAPGQGVAITVHMTRTGDTNPGLSTRAAMADSKNAEILLSIHFNAFNGVARGVETHIRPSASNVNYSADNYLASRIQSRAYNALKSHDSGAKNRGVKQTNLAVLNDSYQGNSSSSNATVRSCLLEVEFIDVQAVDRLLNISPNPDEVKQDFANAIALAILDDIKANQ